MSKTSKQTAQSEIDPTVAAESQALMNLFKGIASRPHEPNRGVTVAGFTPQQEASFGMTNDAAKAFGFSPATSPVAAMPKMTKSPQGIEGYSLAPEYDKSVSMLPKEVRDQMASFYKQAGKKTPEKSFKKPGGKK